MSSSSSLPPAPPPSSNNNENDDPAASLSAMLDVMLRDDSAREALLARLPERLRRPEVVRAMLQNPEVRARLGQLAGQTGMFGGGGNDAGDASSSSSFVAPDAAALERGLAAARAAGIDAGKVAAKLATSPALRRAAQSPRVFAALVEISRGGPDALKAYEGDQEVLGAYFEAGAALQEVQAEARREGGAGAGAGAAVAAAAEGGGADGGSGGGVNSAEAAALRALVADPELAAKLSSPRVRAAMQEVASSPLKALQYAFDPEVREALAAARKLAAADGGTGREPK